MLQEGQHQLLSPVAVRSLSQPHPIYAVPLRNDAWSCWTATEPNTEAPIKPRETKVDYADVAERHRRRAVRESGGRSSPSTRREPTHPIPLRHFERLPSASQSSLADRGRIYVRYLWVPWRGNKRKRAPPFRLPLASCRTIRCLC